MIPFHPAPAPAELPAGFPDPFSQGPPHPLARRAAEALQQALRLGEGLPSIDLRGLEQPGRGKMFGVLVVSDASGRTGYLRGFSGMLDGRWEIEGFAPPLFDLAARDAYWPACEEEWRAFEVQVAAVAEGAEAKALRQKLAELDERQAAEKTELRERHARNRAARHAERLRLEQPHGGERPLERLHALAQQSRADEVEQRALFARHRTERDALLARQGSLDAQRVALERERADRSREIWRKVTDGYVLPNARGERRTLTELYSPRAVPGGAGDCAAPKLLGWAYRRGLRPMALAEFWWGAPPLTGGRTAGAYYPACQRKCGEVVPWMLAGLEGSALLAATGLNDVRMEPNPGGRSARSG